MTPSQFRFAYFTPNYEATVSFYRDGLGFPILEDWDRNSDDRGTLFAAGSGVIEVLSLPKIGGASHLWDDRPPQGAFMVIEWNRVDMFYRRVLEKKLPVVAELKDQEWGHRSFCIREPNGLVLNFFEEKLV